MAPTSSFIYDLSKWVGRRNWNNAYFCQDTRFIPPNWRSKASMNGPVHYLSILPNSVAAVSDRRRLPLEVCGGGGAAPPNNPRDRFAPLASPCWFFCCASMGYYN